MLTTHANDPYVFINTHSMYIIIVWLFIFNTILSKINHNFLIFLCRVLFS